MKRRKPSTLQYGPRRDDLGIVEAKLNAPDGEELRNLFERWRASGPNLQEMVNADIDLWGDLQKALPATWLPTKGARAHYVPLPGTIGRDNDTPVRKARFWFAFFVLNPYCEMLSGPCPRCGKYFVRNSLHQRVYCSRTCGKYLTAIRSSKKSRDEAHERRIAWSINGIAEWSSKPRRNEWKSWVVEFVNTKERSWAEKHKKSPDLVTQKSLTRWVNAREIQQPLADRKGKKQ